MSEELKGTLKTIISDRGFGFIRSGNKEYFFHRDDCTRDLWNQLIKMKLSGTVPEIIFETIPSQKGPRACNLRMV